MARALKTLPAKIRALAAMSCIGVTTAEMLIEAGVGTPAELRKLGAIGAYRRLRFTFGKRVRASYAYAMECAIRDMHWRDLKTTRETALKREAHAVAAELDAMSRSKQ